MTSGDYTVEVTGLEEGSLTASFSVDSEEYIASIEILSKKAPMAGISGANAVAGYNDNQRASFAYALKNQYGETIQATTNIPTFTISTGVNADRSAYKNGQGTVTIKKNTTPFIPGEKVYINAVSTVGTHVATLTDEVEIVLPASYDKAEFKGIYNKTLKKLDTVQSAKLSGSGRYAYYLLFTAKNQYEMDIDSDAVVRTDFSAVSTNPAFINTNNNALETFDVDGVTYAALPLDPGTLASKGGTAEIQLISSSTGTKSTYEVIADAAGTLDTLQVSAPAEYVAVGERVELPYSAKDQYGNAITSYDALDGKVTFTSGSAGASVYFDKQTDGSAKLYLDLRNYRRITGATIPTATQDLMLYLSSVVNANGNYSSATVNVKTEAYPASVIGINKDSSVQTTLPLNTLNQTIKYTDLDIADQYGRTMKSTTVANNLSNYKIYVIDATPNAGTVVINTTTAGITSANVTTSAVAVAPISSANDVVGLSTTSVDGSEKLTFGIAATTSAITAANINSCRNAASEKSITFSTSNVSEYVSFEVKDIDKKYYNTTSSAITNADAYSAAVTVYGVKADGTKVVLPYNGSTGFGWNATVSKGDMTVSGGGIIQNATLSAGATRLADSDFVVSKTDSTYADVTATLNVTIKNSSDVVIGTVAKDFAVSNKAPGAAKIAFKDNTVDGDKLEIASGAAATLATTLKTDVIKEVKDQYGKLYDTTNAEVTFTVGKVTAADVTDGFTVTGNGSNTTAMTNVNNGDTFKVTLSYKSGFNTTIYVVVK